MSSKPNPRQTLQQSVGVRKRRKRVGLARTYNTRSKDKASSSDSEWTSTTDTSMNSSSDEGSGGQDTSAPVLASKVETTLKIRQEDDSEESSFHSSVTDTSGSYTCSSDGTLGSSESDSTDYSDASPRARRKRKSKFNQSSSDQKEMDSSTGC